MAEGMRIGKFQVVGTLGTGAHSTILHVRRAEDSTNYALKVVPIGGADDSKYLAQAQHEFHVGQLPTAVRTSQTVSGAAAIFSSLVPTTGADALISVRVIFPLPSSG